MSNEKIVIPQGIEQIDAERAAGMAVLLGVLNPNEESARETVRRMQQNPHSRTVAEHAIDLSKQAGTWEGLAGQSGIPHWQQQRSADPDGYEGEWLGSIG